MRRLSFLFSLHLIVVIMVLLIFLSCTAGQNPHLKSEKTFDSTHAGQVEQGIQIMGEVYDIVVKKYHQPVMPSTMLIGAVKGMENLVGTTRLLLEETDTQLVVSPLTKAPFHRSITIREARQALFEIYRFVVDNNSNYPPIDIAYSALEEMVSSLDPHSAFLSSESYKDLYIDTRGKFSGIGIVITMRDNMLTVISPIEDTPAYKAGIRAGDQIIKLDGEETKNMKLWEAVKKMRGKKGTSVMITIRRKGMPDLVDFTIVRGFIPLESVQSDQPQPGFGYVRITHFGKNTADDVNAALKKLEAGETPLKRLILDLRDNPGGLLDQAIKVADIFLDKGPIVSIKGKIEPYSMLYSAHRDNDRHLHPTVLLINEGSASASEIVAGALRDHGRALILGTTSFGKGSVQTVESLRDGSGLKLTIAGYYTPNGHAIEPRGIIPDVIAGLSSKLTEHLRENQLTPWGPDRASHTSKTIPVIYVDPLDEDAILNTALEILEGSHSNRVSDLLASAKTIIIQGRQKTIARVSRKGDLSSTAETILKNFDVGKYHALVIGNNDYKSLPKLLTAVNDAKAVAGVLGNLYGFKIKLILNGTRYDIVSTLDKLRTELTPKDNLLIYYAGHGHFDEDADRGYWLPVDASDETSADWISNADITDKLKALRAKHIMVVADSCYSGTLTRGLSIKLKSSDYFSRISRKRARTVLTSGGLEPVVDKGRGGHSVFAKAFLNVLRENIEIMDGTQLFSKIRRPVMVNAPQTPQYSDIRFAGHEGGDFLFIRRR